jgi:hypothetical protein
MGKRDCEPEGRMHRLRSGRSFREGSYPGLIFLMNRCDTGKFLSLPVSGYILSFRFLKIPQMIK